MATSSMFAFQPAMAVYEFAFVAYRQDRLAVAGG